MEIQVCSLGKGTDVVTFNLNLLFTMGDMAWMISASTLVWLMIPGVGFFYSGLSGQKSALSLILLSFISVSVASFQVFLVTSLRQWFLWGYSLVFSPSGGRFIGNFANIGMRNVLAQPVQAIPDLLFALFQGMFAAFTPALAIGAAAQRGRIFPCTVFVFVWATLVYDPIASWTWNVNGWASALGVLDFAGGTPVHITAGATALAYSIMLGQRRDRINSRVVRVRPSNVASQCNVHCFRHSLSLVRLAGFQRGFSEGSQPPRRNGLSCFEPRRLRRRSHMALHGLCTT
jgi:ammonium transporter, Amt family